MGFLNSETISRTPCLPGQACLRAALQPWGLPRQPASALPPQGRSASPSEDPLYALLLLLFPNTGIFPNRFLGICFSLKDPNSEVVQGSTRKAGEERQGRKKESQQSMLAWLPPSAMEARPCPEPSEKLCAAHLRCMSTSGQEASSHYSHLLPPPHEGHPRGTYCLAVRTSRCLHCL